MAGNGSRTPRHFRLSSRAAFAAERLGEIAGLPAGELVEMVLLELAASGEIVEASTGPSEKGQRSPPVPRRGPASVIPIERARRRAPAAEAAHRGAAHALGGRPPPGREGS
jgi:hypothetical protein